MVQLQRIELPDQLYRTVLKRRYGNSEVSPQENINGIRRCEIQTVRMCVTSRSGKLFKSCQRTFAKLHSTRKSLR